VAPDLGWVAHLFVRLQSLRLQFFRLQSRSTRCGLGGPLIPGLQSLRPQSRGTRFGLGGPLTH